MVVARARVEEPRLCLWAWKSTVWAIWPERPQGKDFQPDNIQVCQSARSPLESTLTIHFKEGSSLVLGLALDEGTNIPLGIDVLNSVGNQKGDDITEVVLIMAMENNNISRTSWRRWRNRRRISRDFSSSRGWRSRRRRTSRRHARQGRAGADFGCICWTVAQLSRKNLVLGLIHLAPTPPQAAVPMVAVHMPHYTPPPPSWCECTGGILR